MDISVNKLPWYGQIGIFVVLSALSVYGFYTFYASDLQAANAQKQTRLNGLRADINRGVATARQLGGFQGQVTELEHRLDALKNVLPDQKDVADTLRRIQGLATQSNLTLLRFTPAAQKQEPLYLEVPYQLIADGNYHDLAMFFDRVAKFQRIINVSDISIAAKPRQDPNSTITATLTATTFVLQEAAGHGERGAPPAR